MTAVAERPAVATPIPRRRRKLRQSGGWAALGFLSPWLIGFIVFTAGPMVISAYLSFTDYNEISSPSYVGGANYRHLIHDPKVAHALTNTIVYALIYVPTAMAVSLGLAVLLSRVGRLAGLFRTIFYLPVMTPTVAAGALFLLLLNGQKGIINRFLAVLGMHGPNWTTDNAWIKPGLALTMLWGLGATTVIYLAALQQVPKDLYEAAALDGATGWSRFRRITLPMISGAMFFTMIVLSINALQMFDQAYTMFFGGQQNSGYANDAALFYVVYLFQQGFVFLHMGYASALAWLLFLVILAITAIQVKVSSRFVYYEGSR